MSRLASLALASALFALPLGAQATTTPPAAAKPARMATPCPLHLTDLALTPVQDSAFRAIRAAHRAAMHAVHAMMSGGHGAMPQGAKPQGAKPHGAMHGAMHPAGAAMKPDSAHARMEPAMKASMQRALDAARAVLTDSQRTRFDAAVAAHMKEMDARKASGAGHACDACCPMEHERGR